MSNLLTSNIWDQIGRAVKKQPSKCFVAVAYFGSSASRLLPLKKGSTLIVDMSERAVRSGLTKPSEILKLVNANVEVHSVENLAREGVRRRLQRLRWLHQRLSEF